MATVRSYYSPQLFDIPAQPKKAISKEVKTKNIVGEKERKHNKRKYNASYRLRCKIGDAAFPKKSKNIFSELGKDAIEQITEIKILTKEYGFALKPLAFSDL